jgi:hypothetical protein
MKNSVISPVPLSNFYKFPTVSASGQFNYDMPVKNWVIGYGDITGPSFTYDCVVRGLDGYPAWSTHTVSVQEALTANVLGGTPTPGKTVIPAAPVPLSKDKVTAAGLELCTDIMTNPAFCALSTPSNTVVPLTQDVVDAIFAIKAFMKA